MSKLDNVRFRVEHGAKDNENFPNSDAWTCTFKYRGNEMDVPFYMGVGLRGEEPQMLEVLECLFMDAEAGSMTFTEWCCEYGYNNDSINDLATYELCVSLCDNLKQLLKEDLNDIREEMYEQTM
jgi:hypothetical protein